MSFFFPHDSCFLIFPCFFFTTYVWRLSVIFYLFIYLFGCLFIYVLFVCLFAYLFIYLSIHLSRAHIKTAQLGQEIGALASDRGQRSASVTSSSL